MSVPPSKNNVDSENSKKDNIFRFSASQLLRLRKKRNFTVENISSIFDDEIERKNAHTDTK